MHRQTILFLAIGLAIIAGVAPPIAAYWLSYDKVVKAENRHLDEYAHWTLTRASLSLHEAKGALETIRADQTRPCSQAHIARMRQLTIETSSVDQIGYFQGGRLRCTSWGLVQADIRQGRPDYVLGDGLSLNFGVKPLAGGGGDVVALGHGSYSALIHSRRFVDVLTDTEMTLGVATSDGDLIALSAPLHADVVEGLLKHQTSGETDEHLYSTAQQAGLIAFAVSERHGLRDQLVRERLLFIPLGLLTSGLMVGVVVWMSRQRPSPRKELEIAIRKREFVAHYQPIIELSTGRCIGAEALARWRRPDGTWIAPDLFIPLAEESGLIEPLTDLMIQRVVDDLSGMLSADRKVHVALNIGPNDIETGRFLPILAAALRDGGVDPAQIWLECTESGFMDASAARSTIDQARAAGHLIAIDDFGTGYSSLSILETLPLDALKIDKSFIDAIGKDAATSVVTPHIITIAQTLGFKIIAEGIETPEQEAYIRAAGVEFAQGWLYSKPLPAEAFAYFFRARNADRTPNPPLAES